MAFAFLAACTTKKQNAAVEESTTTTSTSAPTSTSESTTSTTAAPGKELFLAEGNRVCADMNTRSRALTDALPNGEPQTQAQAVSLFTANSELIEDTVGKLRALPQPTGDEPQLAAMYSEVDRLALLGRELADALNQGDRARYDQLAAQAEQLVTTANAAFIAYGLPECGQES